MYPVISGTPAPVKSFAGRYLEDLAQTIKVPYFEGISTCNMARFGGSWWWIVAYDTSTDQGRSISMAVTYCAPTSMLTKGQRMYGAWSRTATETSPWMQRMAVNGSLTHTKTANLPKLQPDASGNPRFWVQCTYTAQTGSESAEVRRAGCFVTFAPGRLGISTKAIGDAIYPTLAAILREAGTVFGTSSDSITDISISARCPWMTGGDTERIYLLGSNGLPLEPSTGTKGQIYRIDEDAIENFLTPWSTTFGFPSLTALEVASGTVTLRDASGTNIGTFPAYSTEDFGVYTLSDYTGVYTYVTWEGYIMCLQEGHLPWSGTSWEQYRAYSLSYDRQAMEQSIDFAQERARLGLAEAGANAVSSVAMGAMGGNPLSIATGAISGAVSFGIQAWATGEEQRISESEARATQALSERRAMGGPTSGYNTAYGLIYCQRYYLTPAAMWLEMPDELTSARDAAYTQWFGYPSDYIGDIELTDGYWQGQIISPGTGGLSISADGPKWDKMIDTFKNGLRLRIKEY